MGYSNGENNKVTVRIFGQDYTIAGNASQKQMAEVAAYVNKMMTDLSHSLPRLNTVSLAVLTAVNTASDLYEAQDLVQEQESTIEDLRKRQTGLESLWENAKQSMQKFKDDADSSIAEKNAEIADLRARLDEMGQRSQMAVQADVISEEAAAELEALEEQLGEARSEAYAYRQELNELRQMIDQGAVQTERADNSREAVSLAAMKEKYKELENSFFDIQMENINLKNRLDELSKK